MRGIPIVTLVVFTRGENKSSAHSLGLTSNTLSLLSPPPSSPLKCRTPDQPMRPYLTEHLPKRLHFAHNLRIERGHLYMKEGWQAAL